MIKEKIVAALDRQAEKCAEWYVEMMESTSSVYDRFITDEGKKEVVKMLESEQLMTPTAEEAIDKCIFGEDFKKEASKIDMIRYKVFYYNNAVFVALKVIYCLIIIYTIQYKILKNHAYLDMCDKAIEELKEVCED